MMTLSAHFYKMCSQQATICTPDPAIPIIPTPFLPLFGIFLSLSSFPNNNNHHQIISIHRVTSFLPPCGLFPHFTIISNQPPTLTTQTKLLLPTPHTTTYRRHLLLLIVLICSDNLNHHTTTRRCQQSSSTLQSSSAAIHSHPSYNRARLPINSS